MGEPEVVWMAEKKKARRSAFIVRKSVLAERIAQGKAEPISDIERQLAAELRADYVKQYGDVGLPTLTPRS